MQYGAYHHNPVNVAIHVCCVPLILFSAFLLVRIDTFHQLCRPDPISRTPCRVRRTKLTNPGTAPSLAPQATNSGTIIPLPSWLTVPYLELNLGTIGALIWGGLYVLLEPVAGTLLAVLCVAGTGYLNSVRLADPSLTNTVAVAVHVVSWLAQFVGHGAFEGRAPALLDNLLQAIFLAPLFVWLEILFRFGYRQELQARVEKKVQAELAKFRAESEKKLKEKEAAGHNGSAKKTE